MTIIKQLNVNGGTAPYKINLVNLNSCTCISFVQDIYTLEEDGLINVEINFNTDLDANCFNNCIVQANIVDDSGCSTSINLSIEDTCSTLNTTGISVGSNPLTFVTQGIGGTPPYNYSWSWFDVNLESEINNNSILNLNKTSTGVLPDIFSLSVTVTDTNGCKYTETKEIQTCKPTTRNSSVFAYCLNGGTKYISSIHELFIFPCLNCEMDYSTMVFNTPSGVTVTNELNNIQISIDTTIYNGADAFEIPYKVYDCIGNLLEGTAGVELYCKGERAVIPNECECKIRIETCVGSIGDVLYIDIEKCIASPDFCGNDNSMNENTFSIISGPFITGSSVNYNPYTNQIEYTVGQTSGIDLIEFTMNTNEGVISPIIELFVNLNCIPVPVLVNESVTTDCNTPVVIDVLANDTFTPGYDLNTLQITQSPSYGSVMISGSNVIYTPNGSFNGIETIKYRICDTNRQCDEATIDVNVTCISVCSITLDQAVTNCDYSIVAQHPDTGVIDTARLTILDDEVNIDADLRYIISNNCIGEIENVIEEHTYVANPVVARVKIGYSLNGTTNCPNIVTGGYLKTLRVYNSVTSSFIDINLDPNNTTYLAGVAGTTTLADLTYDNTNTSIWVAAIQIQVKNALDVVFGAVNDVNYIFEVTATASTQTITFFCKHNPSAMWLGFKNDDLNMLYSTNGTLDSLALGCFYSVASSVSFAKVYFAPCGALIYNGFVSASNFVEINSCDYNNIVLSTSGAITTFGSHNPLITCTDNILTANVINCVNPVYLWSTGATTQSIQANNPGIYSVNITCDGSSCTQSITI